MPLKETKIESKVSTTTKEIFNEKISELMKLYL